MAGFLHLLRSNRNYRTTWMAQVVSEVGDNFNNIAVFALVMQQTHSGLAVGGVMLSRAVGILIAGPIAGVALDRFDRRRIMVASDLVRSIIALAFLLTIHERNVGLLLFLSGLLMFASPFFTSGRASILPRIATRDELHTANSLTQTTAWTSVALGSFLGGAVASWFGFQVAFVFNALSFLFSALFIGRLRSPGGSGFTASRDDVEPHERHPLRDYVDGLRYMRSVPLLFALALVGVGWATGGGAAQVLFSLFGEVVFKRGAAGIGEVWGCAGIGLILGGILANTWGRRLSFERYKWLVVICFTVHGGSYILFSLSPSYALALVFIGLSRLSIAVNNVLNMTQVLRHTPDAYRGRVTSTMESMVWATMMLSMSVASFFSQAHSPREIGVVAGVCSSMTAV
ncbi:MAG: MFS transporter, partial [Bryobacteraceae bacterium]